MPFIQNGMRKPSPFVRDLTVKNQKNARTWETGKVNNGVIRAYINNEKIKHNISDLFSLEDIRKLDLVVAEKARNPALKVFIMAEDKSRKDKTISFHIYLLKQEDLIMEECKVNNYNLESDTVSISKDANFMMQEIGLKPKIFVSVKDKKIVIATHPTELKSYGENPDYVDFGYQTVEEYQDCYKFIKSENSIVSMNSFGEICKREHKAYTDNLINVEIVGMHSRSGIQAANFKNGKGVPAKAKIKPVNMSEESFNALPAGKYEIYDQKAKEVKWLVIEVSSSFGEKTIQYGVFDVETEHLKTLEKKDVSDIIQK